MSNQEFDPAQYKTQQRAQWDKVATESADAWVVYEKAIQALGNLMVESADIRPGCTVLDIATGAGEPAITAARRVGPGGRVVGTDLSPGMLATARQRANALGLKNIEWRQVDAEKLAFPEATFDAALCRFGLMFFPDLPAALERVRMVLRPNARFVATVWGPAARVPLIGLAMTIAQEMLQLPAASPSLPGPFRLAAPGTIEQALTDAGFGNVHVKTVEVIAEWRSVQEYLSGVGIGPPIRAAIARQPAQLQEAVWQGIAEAVKQYTQPDGVVRMDNEAILAIARR